MHSIGSLFVCVVGCSSKTARWHSPSFLHGRWRHNIYLYAPNRAPRSYFFSSQSSSPRIDLAIFAPFIHFHYPSSSRSFSLPLVHFQLPEFTLLSRLTLYCFANMVLGITILSALAAAPIVATHPARKFWKQLSFSLETEKKQNKAMRS